MVARFADDGAATSAKALITGSTSGIGLEIAQELVANGARVILNGIETAQQGDAIAGSLDDAAVYLHGDLSRTATMVEQMAKPKAALGRLDSLVNNAGILHICQLAEFPPGKNDLIIALNQKPGVSHHAPRAADDALTGAGADHQHRPGPWSGRLTVQIGLCRGQTFGGRIDQGDRT